MKQDTSRTMWHFASAALALLLAMVAVPVMAGGKTGTTTPASYTYISLGDTKFSSTASPSPTEQSIMLMGGGYDVGEAFRWMITRAGVKPGTGGHFLVLRATGTGAYNPYILSEANTVDPTTPMLYEMVGGATMGLSSASTLIIPNRTAANDAAVAAIIRTANAIFIAGGDQADYYNYWRGTKVEAELRAALAHNIPIGGTSAGAEMLGEFAFVALGGTVTSSMALSDPFNKYMSIDPLNTLTYTTSFVSPAALAATITDVHVNTRDRLGRTIAFMARLGKGCNGPINDLATRGIALDEETALLMAGSSMALAVNPKNPANFTSGLYYGANSAYLLKATTSPNVCQSRTPLSIPSANVVVTRLSDSGATSTPPKTSYISTYNTAVANYGVDKGVITFLNKTPAPY